MSKAHTQINGVNTLADRDRKKIVCLGDSITYGFPFGPTFSWVQMLSEVIDAEVINKGINGNTTTDMMERFDRAVLRNEPTHVLIMGGINDVLCRESFDRITWNLRLMAEKATGNDIQVIFGLPTAVDEPEFERLLVRIRQWIIRYAAEHNLPVIDFSSAFHDDNNNVRTELLLADGGHPTIEGYQAMFQVIDLDLFQ
ncbi:MAG: SGNH/GDSL hydrolase family protein [Syntrophomonas sp.]